MTDAKHVQDALDRAYAGGPERHHEKSKEQGKLPVRERVGRLLDEGSFTEDALLANWEAEGLGADGVITGMGTIAGRRRAEQAADLRDLAGEFHLVVKDSACPAAAGEQGYLVGDPGAGRVDQPEHRELLDDRPLGDTDDLFDRAGAP